MGRRRGWSAGVLLAAAAAVSGLVVAGPRPGDLVRGQDLAAVVRRDPFALIGGVSALVAWALALWLLIGVGLTAAAALPGVAGRIARPVAGLLAPRILRHTLEVVLGISVASTAVAPMAMAAALPPAPPAAPPPLAGPAASALRGLADPDQPAGTAATHARPVPPPSLAPSRAPSLTASRSGTATPSTTPRPRPITHAPLTRATATAPAPASPSSAVPPAEAGGTTYVVRPGDCLWTIAEAHLPGGSGAAAVADAWPAWYAANRDVVGPDPNLLRPGQSLTVPAAALVPTASTPLAAPAPSTSSTSSNPPVPEAAS